MNYIRAILGQPAEAGRSLVSALQAGAGSPGARPGGIASPQSHSHCPQEPGAAQTQVWMMLECVSIVRSQEARKP